MDSGGILSVSATFVSGLFKYKLKANRKERVKYSKKKNPYLLEISKTN